MRKTLFLFALFFIVVTTSLASAHPGPLDKYRCHIDKSTRTYHCH